MGATRRSVDHLDEGTLHTRERTQQAESLLERLPIVSYMLELDGPATPVYVSPQIEQLFGVTLDDLAADPHHWIGLVVPEDQRRFADALRRLREEPRRMDIEYRVAVPGRPLAWVRDVASVDADGTICGYLVDLTREKALEHDRAVQRQTLDAFFRSSSIGLAITDAKGRYVRINDALAGLNGAPADAHIGRTLADVAPARAAVVRQVQGQLRGGDTDRAEVDIEGRRLLVS